MAWASINDGDKITNEAIEELGVALNERLEIQGRATKTFPDLTSGRRSEKMAEYIGIIRESIENELISNLVDFEHPDYKEYLSYVATDYTRLFDVEDVFQNAGYTSKTSWDTKARVSDFSQWKELRDIFDSLKQIRFTFTDSVTSASGYSGHSYTSAQDAYDEARAGEGFSSWGLFDTEYNVGYDLNYSSLNDDWVFRIYKYLEFDIDLTLFDSTFTHSLEFFALSYGQRCSLSSGESVAFEIPKVGKVITLDDSSSSGDYVFSIQDETQLSDITLGEVNTFILDFRDAHPVDIPVSGSDFAFGGRALLYLRDGSVRTGVRGTLGFKIDDTELTYG